MEELSFKTPAKIKISGVLEKASKDKVAILCHGFRSSKDSSTNLSLVDYLKQKGISTYRLDFFSHGDSQGEPENLTVSEMIAEILAALEVVKKEGYKKIALVGSSLGGLAAAVASSKTNDINLVVLKCPVSEYYQKFLKEHGQRELDQWKKTGHKFFPGHEENEVFKLNYSFISDIKNINAYDIAFNIKCPVLIIHGDADALVPIEQSEKLASLIKNCKFEVISQADHMFSRKPHFNKMIRIICDFIVENIDKIPQPIKGKEADKKGQDKFAGKVSKVESKIERKEETKRVELRKVDSKNEDVKKQDVKKQESKPIPKATEKSAAKPTSASKTDSKNPKDSLFDKRSDNLRRMGIDVRKFKWFARFLLALAKGLKFLTGDKAFKDLPNVDLWSDELFSFSLFILCSLVQNKLLASNFFLKIYQEDWTLHKSFHC